MLLQRLNRKKFFASLCPAPILGGLSWMKARPLSNKPECIWRQAPVLHGRSVERDPGPVLSILRVKMRRRVVRPIHPNDDPIESTNPRHASEDRAGVRIAGTL